MADNSGRVEQPLSYGIHRVSSYSAKYPPNKILEDNPNDWSSRWSSDSFVTPQFLILKLVRPAIVTEIRFGKFKKSHLCNVKRVKIFGGMSEESMIELADECLTNDNNYESFALKHQMMGNDFPCRYVKVVPIQSWRPNFNFSIWFIELKGFDDSSLVRDGVKWLNEFRHREAIRLCLKHLRQKNYSEAFESLQKRTKVQLEDQLLTQLHKQLVIDGDFEASERLLQEFCDRRLFDSYIRKQDYKPVWKRIIPAAKSLRPGMRGGHQMCIDPYSEHIYMFGGWDGTKDLADLWSYSIPTGQWTCISKNTGQEGGPSARSCHKMCLDPYRKKIYTLGRYLDSGIRTTDNLKSDFYVYDIQSNRWSLISGDTHLNGGPQLVFDHQMCMDIEKNTIYVFGGRIVSCLPDERSANCPEPPLFSGLYLYDVSQNCWRKLRDDSTSTIAKGRDIKSRIGHSMLFHQKRRLLYIFAGQRHKEYLSDFFIYHVDTDEITVINDGDKTEVPAAGFTQRATIDPESHEIHVLSGLNRDRDRNRENKDKDKDEQQEEEEREEDESVKNSFWVYDIIDNRWSCIYRNESATASPETSSAVGCEPSASTSSEDRCEPCPRFAHQLVYDHTNKCHYLFGGNPGKNQSPKLRLDDFWTLKLKRCSYKDLLLRCKRLIREQAFREVIQTNGSFAVHYLQNQLSETFNHSDPEDRRTFQSLASLIFRSEAKVSLNQDLDPDLNYLNRTKVFDAIVDYFPEEMTQPKANLIDLVLV